MHSVWADALREYVLYGKESRFLDVVPFMDIYDMNELRLSTDFQEATKYALDVHYCGTHTPAEVQAALPLQDGVKPSTSPEIRDRQTYTEPQIFFLPDSKVQQATIYFYFNGKPYNIADDASDIRLKDLAALIAETCGRKVVFELPDEVEAAGYSKATKARLDGSKIKQLGWNPRYNIKNGIQTNSLSTNRS